LVLADSILGYRLRLGGGGGVEVKNFLIIFFFVFSRLAFGQALPVPDPSPFLVPASTAYFAPSAYIANAPSFTQPGIVANYASSYLQPLRGVPGLSLVGVAAGALLLWTLSDADKSNNDYQVTRVSFSPYDYQGFTLSRANREYKIMENHYPDKCANGEYNCSRSLSLPLADYYVEINGRIVKYNLILSKENGQSVNLREDSFNTFDEICTFYKGTTIGNVDDETCAGYVIPDYYREQGYTTGAFHASEDGNYCPVPFTLFTSVDYMEGMPQEFIDGVVAASNGYTMNVCYVKNVRRLSDGICDYVNGKGAFYTEDIDCRAYYDGGASAASTVYREGHVVSYGKDTETGKIIIHDISSNVSPDLRSYRYVISEETGTGLHVTELVISTSGKIVAAESFDIEGASIALPSSVPASKLASGVYPSAENSPAVRYSASPATNPGTNPGTDPDPNQNDNNEPIQWPDDYARRGEAEDAADKIIDAFSGETEAIDLTAPVDSFNDNYFSGTFDGLTAWRLPPHVSQCPTGSFSVFGNNYTIDSHCVLMESYFNDLSSVMVVLFSLLALFIVLKA
jgi:hypothetical protein